MADNEGKVLKMESTQAIESDKLQVSEQQGIDKKPKTDEPIDRELFSWGRLTRPLVYCVDTEILYQRTLKLKRVEESSKHSVEISGKYGELLGKIHKEGIRNVENGGWGQLEVHTDESKYESIGVLDTDRDLENLFVVDCFLLQKHDKTLDCCNFYFYESDYVSGDPSHQSAHAFIASGTEILWEFFNVSRSGGIRESLVNRRILKKSESHSTWAAEADMRIGVARRVYQKFYEETETGRIRALIPGRDRFDHVRFWKKKDEFEDDDVQTQAGGMDKVLESVSRLGVSLQKINKDVGFIRDLVFWGAIAFGAYLIFGR